jgi:hypothetical protein
MTFQEIRIIATGPCIANQLRDVNTICRRSWYIAAHVWIIYDFKIEVVPFIINFSTEYKTRDRVTRTQLKTGGEVKCTGRVSTSGSHRVNLITKKPVISHE